MSKEKQVVCIVVDDSHQDDCGCISVLGLEDGQRVTPEQAWNDITYQIASYFILFKGKRTYLVPATRNGKKYVRTEQNDTNKDNLLNQPRCR